LQCENVWDMTDGKTDGTKKRAGLYNNDLEEMFLGP
jgi:hypothetical protein